jgi:hypothetical protein
MTSIAISLNYPGSMFCASISDVNGQSIGSIKIKLEQVLKIVTTRSIYYTSDWTGVSQSVRRCYLAGPCVGMMCSACCGDRSAFGQITDTTVLSFPGLSGCKSSCGCAGCGCFMCDSACLYWAWSLVPTNKV